MTNLLLLLQRNISVVICDTYIPYMYCSLFQYNHQHHPTGVKHYHDWKLSNAEHLKQTLSGNYSPKVFLLYWSMYTTCNLYIECSCLVLLQQFHLFMSVQDQVVVFLLLLLVYLCLGRTFIQHSLCKLTSTFISREIYSLVPCLFNSHLVGICI